MKSAYAMIAVGFVMIAFVRVGQIVAHPEWSEMQSLLDMWPTYLCGSVWIILGVLRMRCSS